MDINKRESTKSDENKSSKIPSVSLRPSIQIKPVTSRICRNVTPSLSKIPKRDVANISTSKKALVTIRSIARPILKPTAKPSDTKKSSRSMMSLGGPKNTTPRAHSLASTRSIRNINTQRGVKSKEATPRPQVVETTADKFQKAAERVAAKKNVLAFESMKEKVRSYQTELMKKWEVVKSELPPDEGEYKFIGLVKNSDGQLLTKAEQKVKIRCPQKSLEQFKKDMHDYVQNNLNLILDSLDQFMNSSGKVGDYAKGQECLSAIEEVKKKIKIDNLTALGDILKQIESFESCDKPGEHPTAMNSDLETKVKKLLKEVDDLRKKLEQSQKELTRLRKSDESPVNSDLEVKATKLLKEVDELRTNLEQSQKELNRIKKSDEDKGILYKKELEERDKKLARRESEIDELKNKLEALEKDGSRDKTNHRELQEKLNTKTIEIEDLKKKLKACAQSNATQQEYETKIKKLEVDLKTALKDVERRTQVEHSIGDQATKQADEIRALKGDISLSKKENERLEKEVQNLKIEIIKDRELETQLLIFKEKVKQLDAENIVLRQNIKESQMCVARNTNEELSKLQKSEWEKNQKIDVLEMELTKAHFQNQKLEEKIAMDRQLLRVRCSLIESLQTKESTQKIHLEDLFAEVGERNNDIQMLKSELLKKTEEFQTMFATLSSKQLELTRQENMIKLLQESNERAQTLRVRQEAKNGRLEEEISQLKQTISLYQEAVLPNNVLRKNLLFPDASRDSDCSDNLTYYVDERRRKRHMDTNINKYDN